MLVLRGLLLFLRLHALDRFLVERIDDLEQRNRVDRVIAPVQNVLCPAVAFAADVDEQIGMQDRRDLRKCRIEAVHLAAGLDEHFKLHEIARDRADEIVLRKDRDDDRRTRVLRLRMPAGERRAQKQQAQRPCRHSFSELQFFHLYLFSIRASAVRCTTIAPFGQNS